MTQPKVALIAGVGPGLGAALARRFARGGMKVVLAARDGNKLAAIANQVGGSGGDAAAFAADLTDAHAVQQLIDRVEQTHGPIEAAVYNAGAFLMRPSLDTSPQQFTDVWQSTCYAGFVFARESARKMVARANGTIIFTGATASLRGSANFVAFAAAKAALRSVAQSMARDLGPKGIHVAHVIIDGLIGSTTETAGNQLSPDAIADNYWHLHQQAKSAWTFELDLRPSTEKF